MYMSRILPSRNRIHVMMCVFLFGKIHFHSICVILLFFVLLSGVEGGGPFVHFTEDGLRIMIGLKRPRLDGFNCNA